MFKYEYFLDFNNYSEQVCYNVQLIARKKDFEDNDYRLQLFKNKNEKFIKNNIIFNKFDLYKYYDIYSCMAKALNARIYFDINPKSVRKIVRDYNIQFAEINFDLPHQYNRIDKLHKSISFKPENIVKNGKHRFIDIDDELKDDFLIKLREILGFEHLFVISKSKNGYHLVTKGFSKENQNAKNYQAYIDLMVEYGYDTCGTMILLNESFFKPLVPYKGINNILIDSE